MTRSFLSDSRVAVICLVLFLTFSRFSWAQTQPGTVPSAVAASANSGASAASPISTTVDEVALDLTVRTKHNKPVTDLQPSQLTVTDAGSPVQLSSLRLVSSASGSQHHVALVFDRLEPGAAKETRKMAEKILDVFPEKGFDFAVLQVNGRLRLLQGFTRERRLVDDAIGEATPATPATPSADLTPAEKALVASISGNALTTSSANRADAKLILSAMEQSQRIMQDPHSYLSLAVLQALVARDRLLTGRKFIIYFSAGAARNSDASDTLHTIVGQANRSGVTICVVETGRFDARAGGAMQAALAMSAMGQGGAISSSSMVGVSGRGSGGGSGGFDPGQELTSTSMHNTTGYEFGDANASAGESPLSPLAYGTGGVYIRTGEGSKRQLQQLREDLASWYLASWAPPIKNYDGQFRPINVRSTRKDVVIRSRSGYFAVPPAESTEIRPFEMPLLNILAAGSTLPSDVTYRAGIVHLGALPGGDSGELVVQVPVSQLTVHEDASTHMNTVHAAIVAIIKDSKGNTLQSFGEDFPLHETPEMFRGDPDQVITLQRNFSAEPGVYTLETGVMDREGNKAGAQRSPFKIESPAKDPALSDVALVRGVEPIEEGSETFDPMCVRDGRVVPNLTNELAAGTRSLSLFFLVHPIAGSQSQPALRLQIYRNGQVLTEMPMDVEKVSGVGTAIPYLGTIHAHVFPAGEYQVKVLLKQDGSTASSTASFRVEGIAGESNSADVSLSTASSATETQLVSEASTAGSQFIITTPTDPVQRPTDAEIQAMIEGARQRALAWTDSLENFFCIEVTNHSVDATGRGDWKHKDTLVELMRYVDHGESRSTLMLNGNRSSAQPDQLKFAHSAGEFGAIFHIVFDPSAKTDFKWKQTAFLDGQPVQVFAVKVALANSGFDLTDRTNHSRAAGFHGLVYIDPATQAVRRISIDADDIPSALLIRASSLSVDYSWISMQGHDFLLPIRGAVSLQETKERPVLNEFEFHDYRRFGSQSRVLSDVEQKSVSKD